MYSVRIIFDIIIRASVFIFEIINNFHSWYA